MKEKFPSLEFTQIPSAVEGIDVYKPIEPGDKGPVIEVFKCPQCGAPTSFDISKDGLACPHCGYISSNEKNVVGDSASEEEFSEENLASSSLGWGVDRKDLDCQQCGAVVTIPVETLASTCPFCGSNRVINRVSAQDHIRPLFLIPFKIKPEACKGIASEWLGKSWMTPTELRSSARLDAFTPIFLPYWTFDSICQAQWKAEVGHEETEYYVENGERKSRTVIRWRWQSGSLKKSFEDLFVPATDRHSTKILRGIGKYLISDLVPYRSDFLVGIQAQTYDIQLEKAWESARMRMREDTRQACISQTGSLHVRNFSMELDFADESWRFILAPVYTSVYRYSGVSYQMMINGQTGAIAGPRPADWKKVWLVILAILSPGVILGLIGLITTLLGIGIAIGILALILLVIGGVVGFIIYRQAQELDDV